MALVNENVLLHVVDENHEKEMAMAKEAAIKIYAVLKERPKSIIVELNTYRKYCPLLINLLCDLSDINKAACKENKRIHNKTQERANKKWTKEEDEMLINYLCDHNSSLTEIAAIFGRSPTAISSHVSNLVGRKRISQEVAGRFIGYIDGEEKESDIVGTIYKK